MLVGIVRALVLPQKKSCIWGETYLKGKLKVACMPTLVGRDFPLRQKFFFVYHQIIEDDGVFRNRFTFDHFLKIH